MRKLEAEMQNCFAKCTTDHLPLVDKMRDRLLSQIKKMK